MYIAVWKNGLWPSILRLNQSINGYGSQAVYYSMFITISFLMYVPNFTTFIAVLIICKSVS